MSLLRSFSAFLAGGYKDSAPDEARKDTALDRTRLRRLTLGLSTVGLLPSLRSINFPPALIIEKKFGWLIVSIAKCRIY